MLVAYETLLDAARRHFQHVAGSPHYTRRARHLALDLMRSTEAELAALNDGRPLRDLRSLRGDCGLAGGPAWDGDSDPPNFDLAA